MNSSSPERCSEGRKGAALAHFRAVAEPHRESDPEREGLKMLRSRVVVREQRERSWLQNRRLIVVAGEGSNGFETVEPREGDECDLVRPVAAKNLRATKSYDRTHLRKQLPQEESLVRVRILTRGPPTPKPRDHSRVPITLLLPIGKAATTQAAHDSATKPRVLMPPLTLQSTSSLRRGVMTVVGTSGTAGAPDVDGARSLRGSEAKSWGVVGVASTTADPDVDRATLAYRPLPKSTRRSSPGDRTAIGVSLRPS